MTRTEESSIVSIVETAKHKGFDLRFNYSISAGSSSPESVNVTGSAVVDGKTPTINVNVNSLGQSNTQFSGGMEEDFSLASDIIAECKLILNKTS